MLLVLLTACSGNAGANIAQPTPASILLGATPQAPGAPTQSAPQPTQAFAPVGELQRDAINGLDTLTSYRLTYTLTAEARSGNERSRLETFREVAQNGRQRRERLTQEGAPLTAEQSQGPGAFETIIMGDVAYLWTAEPSGANPGCNAFNANGFPSRPLSDPSLAIIERIATAKLIERGADVNGLATNHYQITTSAGLFGSPNNATGDIWIARDTGVVVKFTAQEMGALGLPSIPQGTLTANYTLEAVNVLTNITLPPECEGKQPQP